MTLVRAAIAYQCQEQMPVLKERRTTMARCKGAIAHQVQAAVNSQPERHRQRRSHSRPHLTQSQDADVHGAVILHTSGAPRFALTSPLAPPRVVPKHDRNVCTNAAPGH